MLKKSIIKISYDFESPIEIGRVERELNLMNVEGVNQPDLFVRWLINFSSNIGISEEDLINSFSEFIDEFLEDEDPELEEGHLSKNKMTGIPEEEFLLTPEILKKSVSQMLDFGIFEKTFHENETFRRKMFDIFCHYMKD